MAINTGGDLERALDNLKGNLEDHLDKKIKDLNEWKVKKDEADKKNQEALDKLIAGGSGRNLVGAKKSFGDAFASAVQENKDQFERFAKESHRSSSIKFDIKNIDLSLKQVGDMTTSGNLSGDAVASYGRNGIIPADTINFRDLVPTTKTSSGLYVFYREGEGEGSVGRQTEGSGKAQVDSDFTEVKVAQSYIAAYQRFTKQMMLNLPWLQTTLSRILLRKFYQKENTLFYQTLATNSDPATASGNNIAEKIIHLIAEQRSNNYQSSFALTTHDNWAALLKTAYPSTGDSYSIPGGTVIDPNGVVRIAGVPVICASWVTEGDIQIVDKDYLERVEVDSLRVEFSYEDGDNFTENKVTARVECMEELNLLRTDAHLNIGTAS